MLAEINPGFLISITLDKRRQNADNTYPVRIRVYTQKDSKRKLIPTPYNFTENEFGHIWPTQPNKKTKHYKIWEELRDLESSARDLAKTIIPFSLSKFESLIKGEDIQPDVQQVALQEPGRVKPVNYYFEQKIEHHLTREAISTAESYEHALKCLLRYAKKDVLEFEEINVSFLEAFEKFCLHEESKSITTVGIYLRNLRAVFNDAGIPKEKYPFGARKYIIKSSRKVKKVLDNDVLKLLFTGQPLTPEQQRAKDFWFFSYFCNGMNMKDILNLQVKDISGDKLTFVRAKTASTRRQIEPIEVYLNDFALDVIRRYGNLNQTGKQFVFPYLNHGLTAKRKNDLKKLFTRSVNQNFRKYARSLGIDGDVSTYYARHSFSTHLIRKGVSIAAVGEALGHTDIKTTMNYFAGFEDESKREVAEKLLDFE
ncbi:tyrosine-type recombinase/integrase [Leadbetterella sp. DM7]|uniref:tyrosine-type recombinase/integrase n=1 Tax=Leadbetterella sp. DM7 TaxID=3235085 RepID=UPI00349EA028